MPLSIDKKAIYLPLCSYIYFVYTSYTTRNEKSKLEKTFYIFYIISCIFESVSPFISVHSMNYIILYQKVRKMLPTGFALKVIVPQHINYNQ